MRFLYVIEIVIVVGILYGVVLQVIVPLVKGLPLFPMLRESPKRLDRMVKDVNEVVDNSQKLDYINQKLESVKTKTNQG